MTAWLTASRPSTSSDQGDGASLGTLGVAGVVSMGRWCLWTAMIINDRGHHQAFSRSTGTAGLVTHQDAW
ncbi:hypothetical protein DY240_20635 [Jiangella rhizosphaerae]|uniref:Uncharacterized protein n=1 Tax=Jiangella rhizosphaerae TaxID=2293569 RepID=A0A418KLS0_9ACTN|nr:hypothetical protein DY240_20635 [Jiangella rhizosphaerae]